MPRFDVCLLIPPRANEEQNIVTTIREIQLRDQAIVREKEKLNMFTYQNDFSSLRHLTNDNFSLNT